MPLRPRRAIPAATLAGLLAGCSDHGGNARPLDCGPPLAVNAIAGRPTASSAAVSVLAAAGDRIEVAWGTRPGEYPDAAPAMTSAAGEPVVVELTGLAPDSAYVYQVRRTGLDGVTTTAPEGRFHTQRAAGASFHFGVQGDSHPERQGKMYSPALYGQTLARAAGAGLDLYVTLGDDFSIERLFEQDRLTQANVDAVYRCQRDALGVVGHQAPLLLVNGNHEQAAGYLLTEAYDTPYRDAPVFAARARVTHFPLPAPDGFYTGDATALPEVGPLRDYTAFEWGDALFVTLDPYWHSPVPVDTGAPGVDKVTDDWLISMGEAQYRWLETTLTASRARWKFVFAHHVDGHGRGAAAILHAHEWGGWSDDGATWELPAHRPGWSRSVHQLLVDAGVTVVFFAHDHLFAREVVDGVIYQAVPNPADDSYTAFNADAYAPASIALPGADYDPAASVVLPNSGFLDVTVEPTGVTVDYLRSVIAGDEGLAGADDGDLAFSYRVP